MIRQAIPSRKAARWRWLNDIPSHWDEGKIVHFSRLMTGGTPDRDNPAFWENGTIPWLASGEVNQRLVTSPTAFITDAALRSSNATYLPIGSVLIALAGQGKTKGMVARLGFPATCNQSLAAFVCDEVRLSSGFLYYYLDVNYRNLRGLVGDDLRDGLSLGLLSTLRTPLPPRSEQLAIAAFLDRKTAAIDALVAKKERLIELLQEKRQVLITQAVTKGLDPNVPMKPSGIEWLGEIPATWTVRPLSHTLAFISYGFTNPMPTEDDGPHMLTANDIGDGIVKYESARRTAESEFRKLTSKSRPVAGDILVTKDGTLGRVAVAGPQKACINQSVAILRTSGRLATSEFIQLALRAGPYQERMLFEAGGTTIKHIYITRLAKMPIAFPPLEDQPALCRYMAGLNDRTAERIQAVGRSIEQLREYRQALISAAVTGKIEIPTEEAA